MRKAVLGLYTYAEFGAFVAAFLPIMGLSYARHRGDVTQRMPGRWMRRFGRVTSSLTPLWRFAVEGVPPPDVRERAYVVVANHESTADPFLLSHLPWDMRWIAKEEIYKLPILGWMMTWGGDIPVRRGDKASTAQMHEEALRTLAAGMSLMIFPEGTRSKDGTLLPFKEGAFRLAIEAQVPILPIAVAGTRSCRPKGSKWFGDSNAIAKVLAPLDTKGLTMEDLPTLRDRTRARIASEVDELRVRLGETTLAPAGAAPTERREERLAASDGRDAVAPS